MAILRVMNSLRKLLRGGSFFNFPKNCRSAYRLHTLPDFAGHHVGFRVVCLDLVE